MNQLDANLRRALSKPDLPPSGAEARVLAAVMAAAGGPVQGEPLDAGEALAEASGGAVAGPSLLHAVKVVAATATLTLGGLALVGLVASGLRSTPPISTSARADAPAPAAGQDAARAQTTPAPDPTHHAGEVEPASPRSSPAPVIDAPSPAERRAPTHASPRGPKPVAQPEGTPAAPTSVSSLERELSLLQTARNSSSPEETLAVLEEHRARFPAGILAGEREVLRIETLCRLGQREQAARAAERFLSTHPGDPLRSRVEPPCAE